MKSLQEPVVFQQSMEHAEPMEAETTEKLAHDLRGILETTSKDYGHAVRSVHAKSHTLVKAKMTILVNLPAVYAQGLFAQPGTYETVLRMSTVPGDVLPDQISTPRGLAIKVFGVPGERVAGADAAATQDFIMVDAPVFGAPDAKTFEPGLALLGKTVDRGEALKKVASTVLQAIEAGLEKAGGKSGILEALGGRKNTNPLGDTYYSVSPFLYGKNIAKFSVAPVSENLQAVKDQKIDAAGRPDALREETSKVLEKGGAPFVWELRVQLCRDVKTMPIEDASKEWSEEESPFVAVARITAEPQPGWNPEKSKQVDDALAFDVWHALAAHRPLGSINRVRRFVYPMSAAFRRSFNGCPMHEGKATPL